MISWGKLLIENAIYWYGYSLQNGKNQGISAQFEVFMDSLSLYLVVVKIFLPRYKVCRNLRQRTLDTWNGMFWEIFLNLKPMEIAKRPYNIICRSIKVMHFCQILRVWLNIGACHAHLKFEM